MNTNSLLRILWVTSLFFIGTQVQAHSTILFAKSKNISLTTNKTVIQPPSAPTNLQAINVTPTSVTLTWSAPTSNLPIQEYEITGGVQNKTVRGSTTTLITGLSPNTTYSFRIRARDTNGDNSGNSNSVVVNTKVDDGNYCSADGGVTTDEHIGHVQLGSIDNNSTTNDFGYSDFTNISTNLILGSSNSITLTSVMTASIQYPEEFKVWIDYNRDNDFEDQGELILQQNVTGDATISKSFTVPQNAINGSTRMRVRMTNQNAGGPCGPSSSNDLEFGEVEDYTIIIVGSGGDTQAPSAPTNLTASNITNTSVSLNWNASTDNIGVTGYDIYRNNTLVRTVTTTSTSISELSPNTSYQFNVRAKDAASNESSSSNTLTITTTGDTVPTPTYCTANGQNASEEFISRVQLGTIDNTSTSTNNGYSDFTTVSTNLSINSSNTITITPTWTGSVFSEAYSVWIDYNQDGDFDDASEQVWSQNASRNTSVSGSFTIPPNATSGNTRMRVAMRFNTLPSSCGSFNFGEVEDYTISIGATSSSKIGTKIPDLKIYPNPVVDLLHIDLRSNLTSGTYTIIDLVGKTILNGKIQPIIDMNTLKKGIYFIKINDGIHDQTKRFVKN